MKELKPMSPMKDVKWIVIHCSYTKVGQKVTVDDLDNFHQAKGWACCGYHWVIYQDGSIHPGRAEKFAGAHVKHYNQHAIGVCYIGGTDCEFEPADTRTREQKIALDAVLQTLKAVWPEAEITGHKDWEATACPSFNARREFSHITGDTLV